MTRGRAQVSTMTEPHPVLGTGASGPVPLNIARLLESRLLVQGTPGSGKSYAVRRLLETTHGRVQQIVLDLEDEYATLRTAYPYVLAGPGRDCPVESRSAALLARKLMETGASAVLNLYELVHAEQQHFVRIFLETLIAQPKGQWRDVLVVLEEAQRLAPQSGAETGCTAAVNDLCARGRKRGLCVVAVTPRVSELSKGVVGYCQNLLIGATPLDADVKRASYVLGFERKDARRLVELPTGRFFAWGPAISRTVIEVDIAQVQTAHGEKRISTPPPPQAKVLEVLAELGDLPAQAASEELERVRLEREVSTLRERVRELERHPQIDPAAVEAARREGEAAALETAARQARPALERFAALQGYAVDLARRLDEAAQQIVEAGARLEEDGEQLLKLARAGEPRTPPLPRAGRVVLRASAPPEDARTAVAGLASTGFEAERTERLLTPASDHRDPQVRTKLAGGGLPGPEQRVVNALYELEEAGVSPASGVLVAFLAGYRPTGGGFHNTRARCNTAGLLVYAEGSALLALTDEGRGKAEPPPVRLTVKGVQERVLARLDKCERAVLEVLLRAFPSAMSAESVAAAAGYAFAGGFNNGRGRLRSAGLAEYPTPGSMRAAPILFLR